MRKNIKNHKKLLSSIALLTVIISLIAAIINWFFWSPANWNKFSINNSTISWDVIWWDKIETRPTQVEEDENRYIKDDETKITALFRYRNSKNYFEAGNVIYSKISYIFSEDKMKSFYKDMTDWFIIDSFKTLWEPVFSTNLISSKHFVSIHYGYKWQTYNDTLLVAVRRSMKNSKDHHIELIRCSDINIKSPLCDFLN